MKTKNTKAALAHEFVDLREKMNELKRREKLLKEFLLEDMDGETIKTYGDITLFITTSEREKFDRQTLNLTYPELYNRFLSTYICESLRYSRNTAS